MQKLFSRAEKCDFNNLNRSDFHSGTIALPTGYEDALIYKRDERAVGTVVATVILPLFHLD